MKDNPACPCDSGGKYGSCCRPFHRGEEPPTPERLMRSRFSAYALGDVEYLWRTLHPEHPDRARAQAEVGAEIRAARSILRYTRLRILAHEGSRVLFHAEIYEKGKERSFCECSEFRQEGNAWRYHSGKTRSMRASDPALSSLRMDTFDEG